VNADGSRLALVVEDEWLVRMKIGDAFDAAGWQVIGSGADEEAIGSLPPESPVPLLVTDIRLCGALSGWDVVEHYCRAPSTIAVIYASAQSCHRRAPDSRKHLHGQTLGDARVGGDGRASVAQ